MPLSLEIICGRDCELKTLWERLERGEHVLLHGGTETLWFAENILATPWWRVLQAPQFGRGAPYVPRCRCTMR